MLPFVAFNTISSAVIAVLPGVAATMFPNVTNENEVDPLDTSPPLPVLLLNDTTSALRVSVNQTLPAPPPLACAMRLNVPAELPLAADNGALPLLPMFPF